MLAADSNEAVCSRCGNFLSSDERSSDRSFDAERTLCEPCVARSLIEPLRGPMSAGLIARGMGALVMKLGLLAAVITLLFELPGFVLFTIAPDLPLSVHTLYGLFTLIGELAIMVMANDVLRGREPEVGRAFSEGLARYGAVFITRWHAGIRTLLWLLLLILPGLYKAASYSLAGPIALFEGASGTDAIQRSMDRTQPHMPLVIAVYAFLTLAFLGWLGAGVAGYAVLFAIDPSAPETNVALEAAIQFGTTLIFMLATFAQMVMHVKLSEAEAS